MSRATYWYRPKEPTSQEQRLLRRLKELSEKHARYGNRRIAALSRQEGWAVGKRHVQRLRRSIGLRVPPSKRKVLPGPCLELGLHLGWHHARRSLRMLTILDEYTRECHVLRRPGA
jgi:putative transposase